LNTTSEAPIVYRSPSPAGMIRGSEACAAAVIRPST
jgi:hypothetical protein